MTVPCSGTIYFSDIANEFGGAGSAMNISQYYPGGGRVHPKITGIPLSGAVNFSNYYCKTKLLAQTISAVYTIWYISDVVTRYGFSLTSNSVYNHSLDNPFGGWGHNGQGLQGFTHNGPFYTAAQLSEYTTVSVVIVSQTGRYGGQSILQQPSAANNWTGILQSPWDAAEGAGSYSATLNLILTP